MSQYLNSYNWGIKRKIVTDSVQKVYKITQSSRVYIKHFEDKDVHSFNMHTNLNGTTYTVSNVVLIKLLYCTYIIVTVVSYCGSIEGA